MRIVSICLLAGFAAIAPAPAADTEAPEAVYTRAQQREYLHLALTEATEIIANPQLWSAKSILPELFALHAERAEIAQDGAVTNFQAQAVTLVKLGAKWTHTAAEEEKAKAHHVMADVLEDLRLAVKEKASYSNDAPMQSIKRLVRVSLDESAAEQLTKVWGESLNAYKALLDAYAAQAGGAPTNGTARASNVRRNNKRFSRDGRLNSPAESSPEAWLAELGRLFQP